MITANINEVKAKLSYYINLVTKESETVVICNHNNPVAEIKAIEPTKKKKNKVKLGVCPHKIELPADFNQTSQDIIDSFYTTKKFK